MRTVSALPPASDESSLAPQPFESVSDVSEKSSGSIADVAPDLVVLAGVANESGAASTA